MIIINKGCFKRDRRLCKICIYVSDFMSKYEDNSAEILIHEHVYYNACLRGKTNFHECEHMYYYNYVVCVFLLKLTFLCDDLW